MINRTQKYDRHSTIDTSSVLQLIHDHMNCSPKTPRVLVNMVPVKVTSIRLRTFAKKGLKCANCGIIGTHFAIERTAGCESYHLNLWAVDRQGNEHLMTHDHIVARSLGGSDNLRNTQTMCSCCNGIKGREEQILVRQRKNKTES